MTDTQTKGTPQTQTGGKKATKKEATKKQAPRDPLKDQRDDTGALINPPVLVEFEDRLRAAHDRGSDDDIAAITKEYTSAREDRARVLAERQDGAK